MLDGWVKIFSALDELQVKLAEDVLKQNGIESHILKHTDTMIPSLGNVQLFAKTEKAENARKILAENKFIIT